ncbi:predicted protein [Scheffersomyces stipitis CBS 6054]|uniref:G1/S-specific cyclin n=1 Tax=Scheffersomyces stipitis (strain ATCC 58785 / CBS 6054 / NBRC 10063 / NRRL Y-11545) TaxID=322104 RepID=A3LZ89_PICST|nr:predicted protein [Scheffersomyces stipitis CBS 6054]ABN68295.2 predicted protein [Scheffersomyces stipitis CBS 6054]
MSNHKSKNYGPPSYVKPKPYSIMLELLESQANKKLTSEYTQDIVKTLSHLEALSSVNPSMIDLQPEIQWFMRPFLLDFLIELHSSFKLQPQTLFLCLNIIDRYCAKRIVFKRHYQLVGCTALWIAGKYEDKKSRVPTLKELTIMCRNAYDEEMFIQMEMHILSTLEWSFSHPTLEDCLQLAITHSKISTHATPCKYNKLQSSSSSNSANTTTSAVTAVARFFCELSLYDKYFLSVPTSLVSITANLLACSMLQIPNASDSLKELMRKVLAKRDEFDEESNQHEIENRQPEVHGAFLSGLDDNAIAVIKRTALMFIIQLSKVTEVLSKKYENLGVIQVINNFHSRFTFIIQSIYENQETIISQEPIDAKLESLAEVLLQFPKMEDDLEDLKPPQSPHIFNNPVALTPVTPPSASSQYSVFSNRRHNSSSTCVTPIHASISANNSKTEFSPLTATASRENNWSSPIMHV